MPANGPAGDDALNITAYGPAGQVVQTTLSLTVVDRIAGTGASLAPNPELYGQPVRLEHRRREGVTRWVGVGAPAAARGPAGGWAGGAPGPAGGGGVRVGPGRCQRGEPAGATAGGAALRPAAAPLPLPPAGVVRVSGLLDFLRGTEPWGGTRQAGTPAGKPRRPQGGVSGTGPNGPFTRSCLERTGDAFGPSAREAARPTAVDPSAQQADGSGGRSCVRGPVPDVRSAAGFVAAGEGIGRSAQG